MCSAFCLSRKGSLLLCLYLVLIILAHNRRLNPDQRGCKKWCREAAGRRGNTRKRIVNVGSVGYHLPTLILVEKLLAKQQILQPLIKLVTECNTHSNHSQGRDFCKDWTVWVSVLLSFDRVGQVLWEGAARQQNHGQPGSVFAHSQACPVLGKRLKLLPRQKNISAYFPTNLKRTFSRSFPLRMLSWLAGSKGLVEAPQSSVRERSCRGSFGDWNMHRLLSASRKRFSVISDDLMLPALSRTQGCETIIQDTGRQWRHHLWKEQTQTSA